MDDGLGDAEFLDRAVSSPTAQAQQAQQAL
jgi:hypothetical protein